MTVSATSPRNNYIGTGAVATYAYSFRIFAATDLRVTKADTLGVETALTYPTDYSVTGVNSSTGGTITLTAGNLPLDYTLAIRFDRTPIQSTDLRNQGDFFPETHEDKFDELTRYVQALTDVVKRSLRLPETEDPASYDMTIPPEAERASKFQAYDASGNSIVAAGGLTSPPVTAFMETLLDDANAAAGRSTLGLGSMAVKADTDYLPQTLADAKGDLPVATAADTWGKLSVGANGTIPMARSAATAGLAYAAALNKAIYGLTYDHGTDATNDLNINTGGCMDATGAYWMTLSTALGKQSDVAWAVGGTTGTPAGGLDTGAVGNNDYYIWLIARSDTGVVDALYSLSSTAPTMPTNYDFKRLIGWFKRVGGTIVAFTTYETEGGGLELLWNSPTLDINLSNTLTTSRRTDAVKVPLTFSTTALVNVIMLDGGAGFFAWVYCPDQADLAPSVSAAPLSNAESFSVGSAIGRQLRIRTSATGTIAARASIATVDTYNVSTMGFTWARRN